METVLPALWVRDRLVTVTVCSAHGQPQSRRVVFTAESAPPGWSYALIPMGLLVFFIVRSATRTRVDMPWPYCDRCQRTRQRVFATGFVLMAGGVSFIALAFAISDGAAVAGIGGLLLMTVGYVVLYWARFQVIARLVLSRDGYEIRIKKSADEFDAQARAAISAAMQAMQAAGVRTR